MPNVGLARMLNCNVCITYFVPAKFLAIESSVPSVATAAKKIWATSSTGEPCKIEITAVKAIIQNRNELSKSFIFVIIYIFRTLHCHLDKLREF